MALYYLHPALAVLKTDSVSKCVCVEYACVLCGELTNYLRLPFSQKNFPFLKKKDLKVTCVSILPHPSFFPHAMYHYTFCKLYNLFFLNACSNHQTKVCFSSLPFFLKMNSLGSSGDKCIDGLETDPKLGYQ